ncbi:predicted protein [Sclerotinia sclerotiorum 1980 UF-70]|uniref:Uncharacterized protein n=2 Tax=Sclerotinia sclerotiorum (strain ATCC 18683 / 1980 / Ss-1) TaxID=665079 RepID=A7EFQ6_SCLS1|nr:predicted protein [Sclerotinia sclerotiorum 1980 UF-70]APA07139.1 hypothetical protein sscle_02g019090 [Sclerotinia sclerotiorum 1980 UF-70]EDO01672.1 predicted protein [Sclerotinia sclerotiorum 1980 UF-70]
MAYHSPSKAQFWTTLPPALEPGGRALAHSPSQSHLQPSVRAQLGPWAQWGHTSASLNGLENMKRPRLTHSVTTSERYHFNKDPLPAIPGVLARKLTRGSRRLDGRLNEYGDPVPRPCMDISGSKSYDDDTSHGKETIHKMERTQSSPEARTLPPPPDPPMTKSATKVMQRTDYDPTMEIREGKSPQSSLDIVTDRCDDSDSDYSQEDGMDSPLDQQGHVVASVPVSPMQKDEITFHSPKNTSSHASSPATSTPNSLVISPEYKERVSMFMQGHSKVPSNNQDSPRASNLEDLIDRERMKYEHQIHREYPLRHGPHNDDIALMPPPLALPPKQSRQSYFSESPEDWEPRTPVTPFLGNGQQQSMHVSSTVSFTSSTAARNTTSTEASNPRRKDFSSGKHPMKSPFPFLPIHKTPDSSKATGLAGSLGGKFSGAFKRLSGGTKTVPIERNVVIPNSRRSATGPDTPMPKKSGFMGIKGAPDVIQKGNEHLHDVVEKVKLKVNKKERRRRELKKQIMVVGVMDQTPDGRASEWL